MRQAQRIWREQLESWALPEHILAAVPDSPWTVPTDVFARRADHQVAEPTGASYPVALAALDPAGSVLDVGCGAGAASLPLAARTTELFAVDTSQSMLDAVTQRAARLGLLLHTYQGSWPEIAPSVPVADVVVCHHVFYNAPDLAAFAAALTEHARRRVVVELTRGHPMRVLNPLWHRLHGLVRPERPTSDDAVAVLRELGLEPHRQDAPRPARPEYASFDHLVALTGQRLCLPADRADELARVLVELGVDPEHPRDLPPPDDLVTTLWWDRDG